MSDEAKKNGASSLMPLVDRHDDGSIAWSQTNRGLTKREHFAAMAMHGLLGDGLTYEQAAAFAVAHADALLAALAESEVRK